MLSSFVRSFAINNKLPAFDLTATAANQVKKMLKNDFENRLLRIGLKDGGCAGFQYDFSFDSHARKGDHVFEKDGAKVVLDDKALLYLRHSTLDYESTPFSSSFKIVLPAGSEMHSCSCGKSVGTDNNPGACAH